MQSESIDQIAKALAAAQVDLTNPAKTKTAKAGTYSYKYADIADVLDCVRPVLSKHGIALTQPTILAEDVLIVQTKLSHGSGQWMTSDYPVCRINGDHQKMGAAMTYARRYSLCSMIGVAADEDTDGQGAAETDAPKRKSSAAAKRDNDWPKLEHSLADCESTVAVDRLQRDYQANEYGRWNQAWRDQADELFDKRRQDFGKAPGEALTLHEQLEGSLREPATRADYVQWCHDHIETLTTEDSINAWWDRESSARIRFSLSPAEESDLKARAKARIKAIRAESTFAPNAKERLKDKAGNELHPLEAG